MSLQAGINVTFVAPFFRYVYEHIVLWLSILIYNTTNQQVRLYTLLTRGTSIIWRPRRFFFLVLSNPIIKVAGSIDIATKEKKRMKWGKYTHETRTQHFIYNSEKRFQNHGHRGENKTKISFFFLFSITPTTTTSEKLFFLSSTKHWRVWRFSGLL